MAASKDVNPVMGRCLMIPASSNCLWYCCCESNALLDAIESSETRKSTSGQKDFRKRPNRSTALREDFLDPRIDKRQCGAQQNRQAR